MSRLVVFSDVFGPWATVVVLRLHEARERARAGDDLVSSALLVPVG